jgi:hypothetical protein
MAVPELPIVAGAVGGAGTSVIAAGLRALDDDLYTEGGPVDVLVCRCTVASLTEAQRVASTVPYPPILAVVADVPSGLGLPVPPPEVTALTRMLDSESGQLVSAMVAVPFVAQWRSRPDPVADAWLLLEPGAVIPAWLAGFAAAMTNLIHAIAGPLAEAKAHADLSAA